MLNHKAAWHALKKELIPDLGILAVVVMIAFGVRVTWVGAVNHRSTGYMAGFYGLLLCALLLVALGVCFIYVAWFSIRLEYKYHLGLQQQEKMALK